MAKVMYGPAYVVIMHIPKGIDPLMAFKQIYPNSSCEGLQLVATTETEVVYKALAVDKLRTNTKEVSL